MDSLNSDLDLLENLSKKISDLLYNNEFAEVSDIDAQRKTLIKKIKESEKQKKNIKERVSKLVQKNVAMIKATEAKLHKLSKDHNEFNKRFKAYSFNK